MYLGLHAHVFAHVAAGMQAAGGPLWVDPSPVPGWVHQDLLQAWCAGLCGGQVGSHAVRCVLLHGISADGCV